MKLEKLKPGQVIYDVFQTSGIKRSLYGKYDYFPVKVISIDLDKQTMIVSHGGNTPHTSYDFEWKKYRYNIPKCDR